jgi:hypothetical protein
MTGFAENEDTIHEEPSLPDQLCPHPLSESGDEIGDIITIYADFDAAAEEAEAIEGGNHALMSPYVSGNNDASAELLRPFTYTPSSSSSSALIGSFSFESNPSIPNHVGFYDRQHKGFGIATEGDARKVEGAQEIPDAIDEAKVICKSSICTIFEVAQFSNEDPLTCAPHNSAPNELAAPRSGANYHDADDEQSLVEVDSTNLRNQD